MIGFIVGTLLGGTVGMAAMCICTAASNADRYLENKDERGIPRDDL